MLDKAENELEQLKRIEDFDKKQKEFTNQLMAAKQIIQQIGLSVSLDEIDDHISAAEMAETHDELNAAIDDAKETFVGGMR